MQFQVAVLANKSIYVPVRKKKKKKNVLAICIGIEPQQFPSFTKIKEMANIKTDSLEEKTCPCFMYSETSFFMNCSEGEQGIVSFDF